MSTPMTEQAMDGMTATRTDFPAPARGFAGALDAAPSLHPQVRAGGATQGAVRGAVRADAPMGLEEYYEEAGPDYAAWSPEFNMHFGYWRWGMNPLRRERMLERMNDEVRARLRLPDGNACRVMDMGCGLGATLRSFARKLPLAQLFGVTLVEWQVEQAQRLNAGAGFGEGAAGAERILIERVNYQHTGFAARSFDGVYAVESSCYDRGVEKRPLLREAYRLLRAGGRVVIADAFLRGSDALVGPQRPIYRKLCACWAIKMMAELDAFTAEMERIGFVDIQVEKLQWRVGPSVLHIPWVTLKFLLTDVVFGKRKMTRARWNNVVAPLLLPLVGMPGGPLLYCMISATKA